MIAIQHNKPEQTTLGELRVQATLENMHTVMHFIAGIGQRLALTEKTLFDVELAVEEAATNIVNHAYAETDGGDLVVNARLIGGQLNIILTDWGTPFDPASVPNFDPDAPVEVRAHGGMGLHFISTLMDSVIRQTPAAPGEPNVLTMTKHIEQLQPGARRPSTLRELNAMLSVSQLMATNIALDELLALIVNELITAIDAERGTLYLIDEEADELYSYVLLDDDDDPTNDLQEIRVKIGDGIAGQVATTGKVINVKDAYHDPRFDSSVDHWTGYETRTLLAAPLRNPDQTIIGVVQVLNKKGGPFTSRDESLLTAMAAQAAINIENTRLYAQEIRQQLIEQELETARAIQRSFLPQQMPDPPGWDTAALWVPMRDVGGDFYDIFPLADGRLAFVVADVSGKGIPAALFMALSVTVLRSGMNLHMSPGRLMDHANQSIISNQGSKLFVTAFTGYLDVHSGAFTFGSAGHNPPLLYRAATGAVEYLMPTGTAMGVFKEAQYTEETVQLGTDDILLLYTDGIVEVINAAEEEFGEERLEALLLANTDKSAQALVNVIERAIIAFAKDVGAFDDETLVVLRCCGDGA